MNAAAIETLTANMRHAIKTGTPANIGGGIFSPAELAEVLPIIAAAPDLLAALRAIIGDKPVDRYGYFAAYNAMDDEKRQAARAAIDRATKGAAHE